MNRLLHPSTAFLQTLPFDTVAYKDMTPGQQHSIFEFMFWDGEGAWAEEGVTSEAEAVKVFGDLRFGFGTFPNDLKFKEAMLAAVDGEYNPDDIEGDFQRFIGEAVGVQPPVVLNHPGAAPDCGLFQHGYDWFYGHWAHQPATEFVSFLPETPIRAYVKVGCEGEDGLIRTHLESETCDVCKDLHYSN